VSQLYTTGTLERLAQFAPRCTRRAAVLSLGFLAGYESNAVLGAALSDSDRGVRTIAESSIRAVWRRAGNEDQQRQLAVVIRYNLARQFDTAVVCATELIEEATGFAEAWNQRAIANFGARRFAESIRDCQQALEINAYHFGAAAGMGQCYLELGDRAAALECFHRSLRLHPDLEGVRTAVRRLERSLEK
jgi:tetratricopeptide (TPR) repeat protein